MEKWAQRGDIAAIPLFALSLFENLYRREDRDALDNFLALFFATGLICDVTFTISNAFISH